METFVICERVYMRAVYKSEITDEIQISFNLILSGLITEIGISFYSLELPFDQTKIKQSA